MEMENPFPSDADETRTVMMRATYDALCKHGYTDLTVQRIGEEFPKSKSLIYQHYDGKDELLVDFLASLLDFFESESSLDGSTDALDRLETFLDHMLTAKRHEFMSAMTELRAQAPHNEAFRAQFTRSDRAFQEHLAEIIRAGIEQGTFQDVDSQQVAEFVLTTINGAMLRQVSTDGEVDISVVRGELDAYLRSRLFLEEASVR